MNILYEAMKRCSTTDTWFAWYPVRLGTLRSGQCVWLRRVWRNRCAGVTIYQPLEIPNVEVDRLNGCFVQSSRYRSNGKLYRFYWKM